MKKALREPNTARWL